MIDQATREHYRTLRAEGVRPRNALEVARNRANPSWPQFGMVPGDKPARVEWEGFTLALRIEQEQYPDTSWAGEFSDTFQEGAVQNPDWRPGQYAYESVYRWFIPTNDPWENLPYFKRAGMAKHDAWLAVQRIIREDYEIARGGDSRPQWVFIVAAERAGVTLAEDALHGIDLGEWPNDSHEVDMSAADVAREALHGARAALSRLCGEG